MSRLADLHERYDQSPWLDNLTRVMLDDGTLARYISAGIRGVTANPSILAKAIEGSDAYDEQFSRLRAGAMSVRESYWELVVSDIEEALELFLPLYVETGGGDGFVSIEVDPALAHDTAATIEAARSLHQRIDRPNAFVKIPATDAGIPAIEAMTAEGCNINITLVFSLRRYRQVIDAYQNGLTTYVSRGGDPSSVSSVASFFVSRVDTEVDRRLGALGGDATALEGHAAIAQAKLAYRMFTESLDTERWHALEEAGARVQRPLWASTSTKNPAYPDTVYVDSLIGPDTVTTLPEATIEAFEDHGRLDRTLDRGVDEATATIERLTEIGIDFEDVGTTLERDGIAAFAGSFDHLLDQLDVKAGRLARR